jgi:hypothetical protein
MHFKLAEFGDLIKVKFLTNKQKLDENMQLIYRVPSIAERVRGHRAAQQIYGVPDFLDGLKLAGAIESYDISREPGKGADCFYVTIQLTKAEMKDRIDKAFREKYLAI